MSSTSGHKVSKITDIYVDGSGLFPEKIEKKLSTISWASQIEEELGNSLIDELLVSSSCSSNESDADQDINETVDNLVSNFEKNNAETLHNSLFTVVTDLKKDVKNHIDSRYTDNFKIEDFKDKLEWTRDLTDHFSKKLNMKTVSHSTKNNSIPRSSYKFCDFGKDCSYNYNHKKYNGCFAQHFVYNFLSADINSLINYIESNKEKRLKYMEILTCMNTICYVINHMKDEYLGILSYYPNQIDDMHKERTPADKRLPKKLDC